MSSNNKEYFIIFDTNVLFQRYESKADFSSFSFNSTYDNVVKTTCLLSDIANFKAMNEVYAKYFTQDCPARAAFAVKDLPMGALVEIEVVAAK